MKLRRPTIKECLDGKSHSWMVVNEDTDIIKRVRWERRWCQKCGALTQCTVNAEGVARATLTEDGAPHLVLPQITKIATKKK